MGKQSDQVITNLKRPNKQRLKSTTRSHWQTSREECSIGARRCLTCEDAIEIMASQE